MELIFCNETDIPVTKTRIEFLTKFFEVNPPTYNEDGTLECEGNRNRSISDLHSIVKSRFPKTGHRAIIRIIGELNKLDMLGITYCSTIGKVVTISKTRPGHEHIDMSDFITNYGRTNYYEKEGSDGYKLSQVEQIKKERLNET